MKLVRLLGGPKDGEEVLIPDGQLGLEIKVACVKDGKAEMLRWEDGPWDSERRFITEIYYPQKEVWGDVREIDGVYLYDIEKDVTTEDIPADSSPKGIRGITFDDINKAMERVYFDTNPYGSCRCPECRPDLHKRPDTRVPRVRITPDMYPPNTRGIEETVDWDKLARDSQSYRGYFQTRSNGYWGGPGGD